VNISSYTKTISVSSIAKPILQELDRVRPNNISFSAMLAIAAKEYVNNHKKDISNLTNFMDSSPTFFSDVESWKKYIEKSPTSELKKIQNRHLQIGNITRKRVNELL
jgi:hypothetical protein